MKLTSKLIGYLNSVFDKDSRKTVALRFSYDGNMNWTISDEILTTIVSGGTGAAFSVDVGSYSLSGLASYISSLPGYTVSYINNDISDLSATILLDGRGIQGATNGDALMAHQSLLWVWLDAHARELEDAKAAVSSLPAEMVVGTASTDWLNVLGDMYDVDRFSGETDQSYAVRIISEVVELKSNNIVLEKAIEDQTGLKVTVADIDWWYNSQLVNDLGFTNLAPGSPPAGGYPYWGLDANDNPVVCSFAVIIGVVNVGALDTITVATIKNIVNKYRAAGTYGRYFAPSGYFLNTNTAAEITNDAVYLSGPKMQKYSEVTI